MYVIIECARHPDQCVIVLHNYCFVLVTQKQADMTKWAENQEEARRKMEIIDAMDRFPRAFKVCAC